jgi:N-glycosylase/DNA lyase
VRIPLDGPLDLEATLHSGQAFRWRRSSDGWHEGLIEGRRVRLRVMGGVLEADGPAAPSRAQVAAYLRLDGSHEAFLAEVRRDVPLEAALRALPGLRVLRQDPWEVLVGFVLSQNANQQRIRSNLEALCAAAGRPVAGGGPNRVPTPSELARLDEADLRRLGLGYRAPYVHAVAHAVRDGALALDGLRQAAYDEALERLVSLPGIGVKVADCVLLYGLGHLDAFPVDVWIRRVLAETYGRTGRQAAPLRARAFALKRFGPMAGYAQHFLFHYRRTIGPLPRPGRKALGQAAASAAAP